MESAAEPVVSVVFITYNRVHTLVAAYETFLQGTDYPRDRLELIVSDDGSDPDVRALIDQLPFDRRCYAAENQGFGANANKGLRAACGDYVLFLQDDWIVVRRPSFLREAVRVLERWPDIGLVLLRDFGAETGEPRSVEGTEVKVAADSHGAIVYSDNPHLKRGDFHDVVGWYREDAPMTVVERDMAAAVAAQGRYRTATLLGEQPFVHIGDRWSFNPGRRRVAAERLIRRLPLGAPAIDLWRTARRRLRQARGRKGMA